MPKLRHRIAYQIVNGRVLTVFPAEKLIVPELFAAAAAAAKAGELHDETHARRVTVRKAKTPHIACINVAAHSTPPEGEPAAAPSERPETTEAERDDCNPKHNERCENLLLSLTAQPVEIVYTNTFIEGLKNRNTIIDLASSYLWRREVQRPIRGHRYCQHDILGLPQGKAVSWARPTIAIEVVYTHLPTPHVFDAWLAQSRENPLLVAFEYIKEKTNYWLKHEGSALRVTVYIWDGNLWLNEKVQPRASVQTLAETLGIPSPRYDTEVVADSR